MAVARTALGTATNKALGGSSWTALTNKSLAPGETLLVCLAALNGNGWGFNCVFAGNNAGADIFPGGATRINLFRFKNTTGSTITGDIVMSISGGVNNFTNAYAIWASKFDKLLDSSFDQTASAGPTSSTAATSGNSPTLGQRSELIIGCCGINGPDGDVAPTITAGAEANNLGQKLGTTGGSATSNVIVVESWGEVSSTAACNAAFTIPIRSWQCSVATYKIAEFLKTYQVNQAVNRSLTY